MRIAIYSMTAPHPRFMTEVTVADETVGQAVGRANKFWQEEEYAGGYGRHLLVLD